VRVPKRAVRRAEASRKNGAKSRGPKTAEGKARSAQNALKHGMRARKYLLLPEEDADEFAALEAAMIEELAPVGALQKVLARRVALAAWRLARADHIEVELFAERRFRDGGLGHALIRDGNGVSFLRDPAAYRGAAMAEFWRALRTLKALQAEHAADTDAVLAAHPVSAHPEAPTARPPLVHCAQPDEPERRLEYALPQPPARGRILHEPAASWLPNEPEPGRDRQEAAVSCSPRQAAPRPRSNEPNRLGKS
jgi:hypothetical protein